MATTITPIQPLTEVRGGSVARLGAGAALHWVATCRDCGDLTPLTNPQTLQQAHLLQGRHLAEHLEALATEIKAHTR